MSDEEHGHCTVCDAVIADSVSAFHRRAAEGEEYAYEPLCDNCAAEPQLWKRGQAGTGMAFIPAEPPKPARPN